MGEPKNKESSLTRALAAFDLIAARVEDFIGSYAVRRRNLDSDSFAIIGAHHEWKPLAPEQQVRQIGIRRAYGRWFDKFTRFLPDLPRGTRRDVEEANVFIRGWIDLETSLSADPDPDPTINRRRIGEQLSVIRSAVLLLQKATERPGSTAPADALPTSSDMADRLSPALSPHRESTVSDAAPKAFISYAWEDDVHRAWVSALATRLRSDGVEVHLDRWHLAPGDQLPEFMERAVRENDYVLIICTPRYCEKSDSRTGGVGYEGDIMTAEVFTTGNHRKFIPILRKGAWVDAAPSWLKGKVYVNLTGDPYREDHYRDLLVTLLNMRAVAPPVGPRPRFLPGGGDPAPVRDPAPMTDPRPFSDSEADPIRITGIIVDEIGVPRNDGTRGSVLYAVPFRLSRSPSAMWARLFVETWDHPPRWTSAHRQGIARVTGDKVILDGTTIEEVESVHRDTLKVVVERVNRLVAEQEEKDRRRTEAERRQRDGHARIVREGASHIRIDD